MSKCSVNESPGNRDGYTSFWPAQDQGLSSAGGMRSILYFKQ